MPHALLIEDDVLVAAMAGDALEELGYQFTVAASAAATREIAGRGLADFDVAVVDIGLPDGRGDVLAIELRGLRADLPLIIASGYGQSNLDERINSMANVTILGKPFDSASLQAAIDKVRGLAREGI